MKTIILNKSNVEAFAEEMFRFNCYHEYNSECFSTNDILRERSAFYETDMILEKMAAAGFNMKSIPAFKKHNWNIKDLIFIVNENPELIFSSLMYEQYLDSCSINDYYLS